MAKPNYASIPGSEKQVVPGATAQGPIAAHTRIEVTVRVKPRQPLPSAAELDAAALRRDAPLSHDEYENQYGADPADIARVEAFARAHHLTVVEVSPPRLSVILAGTVENFQDAFDVELEHYDAPNFTYRGRVGTIGIPRDLVGTVEGVFGLDDRPVATSKLRLDPVEAPRVSSATFSPPQLASLYNFPTGVDGSGQCIGIIELGGGYRPSDLQAFFKRLNLPLPKVTPVSVPPARNSPGQDADGEVVLDIEIAGALAPGASIAVYFASNNRGSKGFLDAITQAVHDKTNNPSVISISWGGPEEGSTPMFQSQFNQALQAAAVLGITVCVAAGDNGAADIAPSVWDGLARVDYPASSPYALACGGTNLVASGGKIRQETVWNQGVADTQGDSFGSTGGGVSQMTPPPTWQRNAGVPVAVNRGGTQGRGVPDVAGDADPATGYNILLNGQVFPIGGTSAVAPLWAALIARINQQLGRRVGFINPKIYALPAGSPAFHDITTGNNRVSAGQDQEIGYDANAGWDPCTGLGTPDGVELARVL